MPPSTEVQSMTNQHHQQQKLKKDESEASSSAVTGMNRTLLESLTAGANVPSVPAASSLNFLPAGVLPVIGNGLPYIMGQSLFGPSVSVPGANLAQLSSGIQALQGFHPQQQVGQRSRPNAKEIQDALNTLAAATAPLGSGMGSLQEPNSQKSFFGGEPSLPTIVFMECDDESLSDYQCLLRKQIEFFEA